MNKVFQRGLFTVLSLLCHICSYAYYIGDEERNFVSRIVFKSDCYDNSQPNAENSVTTLVYYDGLGRKLQTVFVAASNDEKDLVDYIEYDSRGRVSKEYLIGISPTECIGDPSSLESIKASYADLYPGNEPYAYTEYNYATSVEGRLNTRTSPGIAWKTKYRTFSENSISSPGKRLFINSSGNLELSSEYYQGNELRERHTIDEDGVRTSVTVDRRDSIVRKSRYIDDTALHTDFIYDSWGRLRYVIPPMAMELILSRPNNTIIRDADDIVDKYCFIYKYDDYGHLISKKLPGADPVLYIYDQCGLIRYSQDGNQRLNDQWMVYAYDKYFRLCYEALATLTSVNASSLQNSMDNNSDKVTFALSDSLKAFGYNYIDSRLKQEDIMTVSYYDNHDFIPVYKAEETWLKYEKEYANRFYNKHERYASGQLTGRALRILDGTQKRMMVSAAYHDIHGRIIQTVESNIAGGYDRKYFSLDLDGTVTMVNHYHKNSKQSYSDRYLYEYDQVRRPTKTYYSHNGGKDVLISEIKYDAIGRVTSKTIGNGISTTEYVYNCQGQLVESINPAFSQRLYYEHSVDGSTPRFNGNVSAMKWEEIDDLDYMGRLYKYTYDGADRLTEASYSESGMVHMVVANDPDFSETYDYDLNGNMTGISSKGLSDRPSGIPVQGFSEVKNISLSYHGNQMLDAKIRPTGTTVASMDNSILGRHNDTWNASFRYDANGNLIHDGLRHIDITYNHLNLPKRFDADEHRWSFPVTFTYDASGRKLRRHVDHIYKEFLEDSSAIVFPIEKNKDKATMTTSKTDPSILPPSRPGFDDKIQPVQEPWDNYEYCGNYIYYNKSLRAVLFPGGYIADSMAYYFINDYQGNVRAVIDQTGSVRQVNHYYPYGTLFAESDNPNLQQYKFSGMELEHDNGLNLYDFGARRYDPIVPAFTTMDPLADTHPDISPYAYCASNPIRYIDPSGMDWIYAQYEDDCFFFFDERVKSKKDIATLYSESNTIKTFKGSTHLDTTIDGKKVRIDLKSNGDFYINGVKQDTELDSDGIHIGLDKWVNPETKSKNFYGKYLGPNNPLLKDHGIDSYSIPPIDMLDYAAFLHDREYDKLGAKGRTDAIFNEKVLTADRRLVLRAYNYLLSGNASRNGTKWALGVIGGFSTICTVKQTETILYQIIH